MGILAHSTPTPMPWVPLSKLGALADVCPFHPGYIHGRGVLGVLQWARPAVDADHFLLAHEVIGALREADFKEESSGEQGRERSVYCEGNPSYIHFYRKRSGR